MPIADILALSQKFIEIPSTAHTIEQIKKIADLALAELKKDFTVEHFNADGKPSILIHNAKPGTKHFKIILNAHLDVVSGKESQFIPQIKDGKLFGRGAFDMKAAAAVMIYLFNDIAQSLSYPIGLQLVTDEELANGQGTRVQLDSGVRTEMVIIGECGSNMDIIHENKGLIHALLTTTGTTAHGAYPWKGNNAIAKMHEAISRIHEHFPTSKTETFDTTVTVSQIGTTNQTWNLIPDNCTATLDIRFNRLESETILRKLKDILPSDIKLEVVKTRSAHFTEIENGYIKLLQKAGKSVLGKELTIRKTFGGSDSTFFSEVGCDAIEFGPRGAGQHHDEEYVEIKSLEEYYQILKTFLLSVK
jgi:succinyl-diaminopimelate desuccinylase